MPRVSVVIPTYNRAHLLPRAIDSVIGQSFPDWELIVVDDGSTDDTAVVLSRYTDLDDRVTAVHRVNGGELAATNTGLDAATGDYLAVLHSDDAFAPDFLADHVALIDAAPQEVVLTIGGRIERYPGDVQREISATAVRLAELRANRADLCMSNHLFLRRAANRVRFDEALGYYGDWDFLFGLLESEGPDPVIALTDAVGLTLWRDEADRIGYLPKMVTAIPHILDKYADSFAGDRHARASWEYIHARNLVWSGDARAARGWFLRSWRDQPRRVPRLALAGACLLGKSVAMRAVDRYRTLRGAVDTELG